MANISGIKSLVDHNRGIPQALAAGKITGDFGAVATATIVTATITDRDIVSTMLIHASITAQPAADWVITKCVAGNGSVVITLRNVHTGNSTAGNTTISYFAR